MDYVERLGNIQWGSGLHVYDTGSGIAVTLANPDPQQLFWGRLTGGAFTSGATVTLNKSTADGTELAGPVSVTVYVKKDKSSYTMANSTNVPGNTVIPYIVGSNGDLFVFGKDPVTVQTAYRWNSADGTDEIKTRDDWGNFCGTESDWFDADAAYHDCEEESGGE